MSYACFIDFNTDKDLKDKFLNNVKNGVYNSFTLTDDAISIWGSLHEDWSFEVKSNFQSYAEAIGSVSGIAQTLTGIIEKLKTASSLGSGRTNIQNDYNKLMVWKDTEPITMNVKLVFETKTDPYLDVYLPTMLLLSLTSLSSIGTSSEMRVPGFYAGIQKSSLNKDGQAVVDTTPPGSGQLKRGDAGYDDAMKTYIKKHSDKGKLLSNFTVAFRSIKGGNTSMSTNSIGYSYKELISFGTSFINSVKPTFSKDRTTSGVPLRAEVDIGVQSLFSANDDQFARLSYDSTDLGFEDLGSAVNIFR